MKYTFRLRGKEVVVTSVAGAVAVKPAEAMRRSRSWRSDLAGKFGIRAKDTSAGGRVGLELPSRNRKLFEKSGWMFVEPKSAVESAAEFTRTSVDGADAVQQVFVDRSGNLQIGTDVLTVRLDPELPDSEAKQRIESDGLRIIRKIQFTPNTFEVLVPQGRNLFEVIAEIQDDTGYLFAEPMMLQAITGRLKPTDPYFGRQWQHTNDGSNGGTIGADIKAEQAWDLTRGQSAERAMRIAVIDNGMQVDHRDLTNKIVSGGYFESNGGASDVFSKYAPGAPGFPDSAHGTFCMGMAAAEMNNSFGGCGSAPEADLIAIACLPDQIGTQATLARAIAYAADPSTEDGSATAGQGADVIACSLGPNGADWELTSVLDLAIRFAAEQGRSQLGIPIFWAVSNGYFEVERDEVASHPNVIAVGRSNRTDRADGSAYGPKLEFLAPGAEVYNTTSGDSYRYWTGTSFAAPLAAGVGALVLSRYPNWTAQQVRSRLVDTCDKIGGVTYDANGKHDEYGYGRINAERAVA